MFCEDLQYDVLGCADINHIFFYHLFAYDYREHCVWFMFFFFFFSSTTSLLPTHLPPPLCTHAQSCNPMDSAHQTPLSMDFSKQEEYWSGLPFPSPLVHVFMDQKPKEVCFCIYTDPYIYVYICVCVCVYICHTHTHTCTNTHICPSLRQII